MENKKTSLAGFTLALFITLTAISAMAQKTNFSGSWNFDESQSILGDRYNKLPFQKKVKQDPDTLKILSNSKLGNGEEVVIEEKYALNGSETEIKIPFKKFVLKSKASWSSDGKILTIYSVSSTEEDGKKQQSEYSQSWKLSEDGKTLSIERKINDPNGKINQTIVYKRL